MSFSQLPTVWVLTGIGGIAALLYVLQRLRIRHQPVTVVTTLFWRIAAEEAPARTFRERFRHPWAYALILLISLLLWLAFAGPETRRSDGGAFHTLVIDGSAGMAAGSRFDDAVAALKTHVRRLPAGQRHVVWSGGGTRTLLAPGEHELLLEKRLDGLRPEAAPAGVENLLRQLAASARPGQSTEVVIFGDAPIRQEFLALNPGLRVARASIGARKISGNSGITALGVTDAESGAWDRVDVFIRVESDQNNPIQPDRVTLDIDGKEPVGAELRAVGGNAINGLLLANVPATGGLLTVRLAGEDVLPLDNVARIRLPEKPRLKVSLSRSLETVLRPVLEADRAVQITDVDAVVAIRRQGETVGAGLPALEFVASDGQRPAFLITHPENLDSTAVFNHAVKAIGLKEIDAMALAESAHRPIEASVATGPQWRFEVWQDLLSDDFNFTQSRSFPLFIANAIRWLANTQNGYPYVAAGKTLAGDSLDSAHRIVGAQGRMLDPVGVSFTPLEAGDLRLENNPKPLAVSLLDPATTLGAASSMPELASQGPASLAGNPIIWLLLGALALLGLEWYFYQTGRVP